MWLWEHHNLANMTLYSFYSLQSIPDAPLQLQQVRQVTKVLQTMSEIKLCCTVLAERLFAASYQAHYLSKQITLRLHQAAQLTVSKPTSRPLQTCFVQVMILSDLQSCSGADGVWQ